MEINWDNPDLSNFRKNKYNQLSTYDDRVLMDNSGLHNDLFNKISHLIDKRDVYFSNKLKFGGCVVFDEKERKQILIKKNIWEMRGNNGYWNFVEVNDNEFNYERTDFLIHVLAHEYGHIIFDDKLKGNIIDEFSPGIELNEAFAFWFGDRVTGFNSPSDLLGTFYENPRIIDGKRIYDIEKSRFELRRFNMYNERLDRFSVENIVGLENLSEIVRSVGLNK